MPMLYLTSKEQQLLLAALEIHIDGLDVTKDILTGESETFTQMLTDTAAVDEVVTDYKKIAEKVKNAI